MTAAGPATIRAVLIALAGLLVVRLAVLAALDPATLVTKLPDDQFYYLVLAREFAASGRWTFDGGISTTSGFHPLAAYVLVGLFLAIGDGVTVAVVATLLAAAASMAAACVVVPFLMRCFGLGAGVAALVLVPVAWWQNAVWVMEWPIVVLVSALAFRRFHAECVAPTRRGAIMLLGLGAIGSMARADFGGLAGVLFVVALLVWPLRRDGRPARAALALVLGATIGLALVMLHHWLMTGSPLPGSARIKSLWVQVVGYRPLDVARFLVQQHLQPVIAAGGFVAAGLLMLAVAGLAGVAGWRRRAALAAVDTPTLTVVVGAASILVFYVLFYGANAGVQPWYTANVAVALLVLLAFVLALPIDGLGIAHQRLVVVAALAYAGLATLWAIDRGWDHQRHWVAMAAEIRRLPPEARVGAWNAGLVRFLADRPIVNLDGVVNDGLYPYVRDRRLGGYLRDARIAYVADFALMVDDDLMRRRGGYADPAFRAALDPVLTIPGSAGLWGAGALTLWRVRD